MVKNFNWGESGCLLYSASSIYASITSHNKAKNHIAEYLSQVKGIAKLVHSFLWFDGKGIGSNNSGQSTGIGFDDPSVKKGDIMFLFVRHVESVFSEDALAPAEIALIDGVREINPHWGYTVENGDDLEGTDDVIDPDIEDDGCDEEMTNDWGA